ncbi:MAG: hypothetical protein CL773_00075 [Chloroflexi bacterium]|nr:hypothetical protein [Chloroflexota bacterium]|tara:strand:- start:541 stop:1146 length:606 start_codon:yes stop_codon:yes gene_type:complete
MENELEMIQTLSEYQNFGLVPFPCSPFSTKIHDSIDGRMLFHKASQGIQMKENEIIEWFGEKKLDNCGLIAGEKGNLSVLEFDNQEILSNLYKTIKNNENISNLIFGNFLENLNHSTTMVLTPEKKLQFWFNYSKNLPTIENNYNKIDLLKGIRIYSDGYIVAPPSFVREKNNFGQYELLVGRKPSLFPKEIDFFQKILSK